jgi:hypothetical protein
MCRHLQDTTLFRFRKVQRPKIHGKGFGEEIERACTQQACTHLHMNEHLQAHIRFSCMRDQRKKDMRVYISILCRT